MKRSVALLLALVLCITILAACGGDGTNLTGKYALTSMELEGTDMTGPLREAGMSTDGMYIEFLSGGKFRMSLMGNGAEGTYTLDGSKITLTAEGGSMPLATISGNKITMEDTDSNTKMVFEKK
ncbi:MAG: hypothetical protein LBH28_06545 [Oscillospiraceae bacterium]|nr:hypothetical protein [Oscillospiraceae bacterium]